MNEPRTYGPRISAWGHEPSAPRLEVRCDRPPEKVFGYQKRGCKKIRSVYDRRGHLHPEMTRRRRELPELRRWEYRGPRFEVAFKRSDCTELDLRFAQLLMLEHNVRTLEVGAWSGNQVWFWDREQLAERLGEKGLPLSLDQVDRLISRFVAFGWIYRRQRRRGKDGKFTSAPAVLKIKLKFLSDWGVLQDRKHMAAKIDRREAQQAEQQGAPHAAHEVTDFVARRARELTSEAEELEYFCRQVARETSLRGWELQAEARRRWKAAKGPPS